MKLYEAKELIKDVFESSFDKDKYRIFIKNLLKDIEEKPFIYTGSRIPRAFDNYIRKLERIGKFEDDEGNVIDILIVELKREHSIEYARSTQRNFIRWYLAGSRGGQMKDAALVAFHNETSTDWRFSFIKMQYSLETKKDELTPAKRYSFLVGEKGKSHTAQQQLVRLFKSDDTPLLSDIEEAFNIETVTNEFFEKYKWLVFNLVDEIEKIISRDDIVKNEFESKNIQVIDFAKKLMGQIVFLYFLQRKGWLGLQNGQKYGDGDRNFLRTLYNMKRNNENFFNDYLEYLFYDALSQKRVTDLYPRFNCRIPFLNGGLFDPINFYDWEKTDIVIPDELFTNTNKTKEGDIGDGILDVFDRYNFTVKEDEPLDKEVAVDPEMLGKVFERMLDVKERKSKGAFYTPREIVHYMSQESLIHYLDTALNSQPKAYQKLGEDQTDLLGNKVAGQTSLEVELLGVRVPKEDIEKLIKQGEQFIEKDVAILDGSLKESNNRYQIPESIRKHAKEIDRALENIRVCDPAVGSGAFPVGVMTEIVKARSILLKIQHPDKEPSHYDFKNHAIHHCLYGVDIDPSAVEICKLRLWLSLVVDEQRIDAIEPLPNLDYKIVKGNSLIGMPDGVMRDVKLEEEINDLMEKYYAETDKQAKRDLKTEIDSKIKQLLKSAEQFTNYPIDFDFKLFFHEVFNEKVHPEQGRRGGFDVVIGNPPYGFRNTLSKEEKKHFRKIENIDFPSGDIAELFVYKSIKNLVGLNKVLTFIIPKKSLYGESWKNVRKIWLENDLKLLLDASKAFEKVLLEQVSFSIKKRKNTNPTISVAYLNNTTNEITILGKYLKNEIFTADLRNAQIYRGIYPKKLITSILENSIENTSLLVKGIIGISNITSFLTFESINSYPCLKGIDIIRYGIKDKIRYLPNSIAKKYISKYSHPKIIAQEIIAHIQNPYPHIKIMMVYDNKKRLYNDTCVEIVSLDKRVSIKFLLTYYQSRFVNWYAYNFVYNRAIRTMHFINYYITQIPIPKKILEEPKMQDPFINLSDYLTYLINSRKVEDGQLKIAYFEQLTDGMVFELYFEDEVKKAGRDILKYLTNTSTTLSTSLTPITDEMSEEEKMEIIARTFNELYDKNHPVRQNLEGMDEIEEIRIIKGLS